jgi:KipI family sensor histidine kinase inhibitor
MDLPTFKPVSDHAVLIEFGTKVSDDLNRCVVALDKALAQANILGVIETVPALVNLLVLFDPLCTTHTEIEAAVTCLFPIKDNAKEPTQTHVVPVCYDENLSPDIAVVADAVGLSVDEVIAMHLSSKLRVSMYGFAPGYAYLSGLPEAIQVPRKPSVVRGVPIGRVMIAGPQCLITTVVMPTGWSIIGRSPFEVMQDDLSNPFIFDVGDNVVFKRMRREDLPVAMQAP